MKVTKPDLEIVKKYWYLLVAGLVAVVLMIMAAFAVYSVSNSRFYNNYSSLKAKYKTWSKSSHKDVACIECHTEPGGLSFKARSFGEFYKKVLVGAKYTSLLEKPSKEACIKCHERPVAMLRVLSKIPHRAHPDLNGIKKNCASCHKWLAHDEAYQAKHKKIPMNKVCLNYACHAGNQAKDECSSCHHKATTVAAEWKTVHKKMVDERGGNGCFDDCHKSEFCRNCHTTGAEVETGPVGKGQMDEHTKRSWAKRHGKWALEDESQCFVCHISKEHCNTCHKDRPASHGKKDKWIGSHKKVVKKEGDKGCLSCHERKNYCAKDKGCHKLFKEKGL